MPTVEVVAIDGMRVVDAARARQALGVRHRLTFNLDRAILGLQHRYHLTELEVIDLFVLRRWLQARPGVNSRESFKRYRKQPALLKLKFQQWGINLDLEIQQFTENL